MAITYGAGSQVYYGFLTEVTPGTVPVGTPHFIPVDPDSLSLNYDAGRQALKLGMGTIFNDFTSVELQAKGNGTVSFPLWGTLGQNLLTACGMPGTGAIVLPSYLSSFVQRVAAVLEYPGCRASKIDFTASSQKEVMAAISFDFTGTPTQVAADTFPVPTFVSEKPFVWADMQPATLVSGNANVQDLDNIALSVNFNQAPFYGNHGSNLPSELITTDVEVTGTFTRLFEDVAEYNLYNAHCMIPGPIIFEFISSCPNPLTGLAYGTPASVIFTMPNCIYTRQSFKNPLKGPITEDYSFVALATTGASPLSYVVTAAVP